MDYLPLIQKKTSSWLFAALLVALTASASACEGQTGSQDQPAERQNQTPGDASYTDRFEVEKKDLVPTGRNSYFILEPGYVSRLEGSEGGEKATLTITVLNETKNIDGVQTRIVEERHTSAGKLAEVSRNYFAIDKRTDSVYYFGEDSRDYEDGKVVSTKGSWEAGSGDARSGLIMPGLPLVGAKYFQEIAPKVAMDRAEITDNSVTLETPAGKFDRVLRTRETSPLEPAAEEFKYYARGVGLVIDADLELVSYGFSK